MEREDGGAVLNRQSPTFHHQSSVLLAVLAAEVVVVGLTARNFLTLGNAAEVTRLSVEIGLLAVALTPVIVGGGIDLSVGALLGLTAVVFGWLWRDLGASGWWGASAGARAGRPGRAPHAAP